MSTQSDPVIIIGGGLAGLFCALKLAPRPVTILAAAPIGRGASSAWAQAGIAAAVSEGDTREKHVADTIAAGDGIVDETIASLMASEAASRVHDLLGYGVPFDRDLEGKLQVSREAAHSESRIVRVRGDMAGRAIMQALVKTVENTPSIRVMEGYVVEDLMINRGSVTGVIARTEAGRGPQVKLSSRTVVIATGGIGHLYAVTTNPSEARGEGIGMAARAGAMMADMEFVQFHPTALDVNKDPAPLATEALRGHGATLINRDGERFMLKVDPDAELAPRDVVARGIYAEVMSGRGAWLDCTKAVGASFAEEFPTVYKYCRDAGIDPVTEPIPVVPAAHYFMGGILTDADGQTSIEGLWACGECTSTGAHGANRLASNSLLEAVVFSARIAARIGTENQGKSEDWSKGSVDRDDLTAEDDTPEMTTLRKTMSESFGVVRDRDGMMAGLRIIVELERSNRDAAFRNVLATAKLVAISALRRHESRGGHFRTDFPEKRPEWQHRTFLTLADAELTVSELMEFA
jgi:L-aspartate oxidase